MLYTNLGVGARTWRVNDGHHCAPGIRRYGDTAIRWSPVNPTGSLAQAFVLPSPKTAPILRSR